MLKVRIYLVISNKYITFAADLRNNKFNLKKFTIMAKNNFIKQLTELKKKFLEYAKDNSKKVNKNTFEIDIWKYYLTMRVECNDKSGNCIVFTQEIELDSTNDTYQKPIHGNMIYITD